MSYNWQTYKATIKMDKKPPPNYLNKLKKGIINTIQPIINQQRLCMKHKSNYALFTNPYRPYRRGKNRCKYCGLKKEVQSKELKKGTT